MTGYLMHVNATVNCPHGGHATCHPAQTQVRVTDQLAASVAALWTVTGCPFTVGGKPQPCVTIRWLSPSGRIKVTGSPAELSNPTGTCFSAEQIPQGPAVISAVQHRVVGE
jgi:hypothetical protein